MERRERVRLTQRKTHVDEISESIKQERHYPTKNQRNRGPGSNPDPLKNKEGEKESYVII